MGGQGERWLLREDLGIAGNTHMMMVDSNSDEIAALVHAWLLENALDGR